MVPNCPDPNNPDWKRLVAQVGLELANITYVYYGYDYPVVPTVTELKKTLGFKSKVSSLHKNMILKRIDKYNAANKTSHCVKPPKLLYGDTWELEMVYNYLPVNEEKKRQRKALREEPFRVENNEEYEKGFQQVHNFDPKKWEQKVDGYFNKEGDFKPSDDYIDPDIDYLPATHQFKETIIKKGVQELFESNPELANEVYEALGFKQSSKNTDFSDTEVKEEVYHSSTVEFNEFKQGKDGAIHFGDKKAATDRTNKSSKKYLKKVKLKVNNLIETVDSVDFEGTRKDKESSKYIVEKLNLAKTETQEHLIALFANEKITKEQLEQYWNSSLETIYKEIFNSDGYSYINLAENKGSRSYVVFNPNQIEIIEDGEIKYNEKNDEYEYINNNNSQITPQQKQQAQQLYSQYLSNFVNTNFDSIITDLQSKKLLEKKCS